MPVTMLSVLRADRRLAGAALLTLAAVGCFLAAVVSVLTGFAPGSFLLPLAPAAMTAAIFLSP